MESAGSNMERCSKKAAGCFKPSTIHCDGVSRSMPSPRPAAIARICSITSSLPGSVIVSSHALLSLKLRRLLLRQYDFPVKLRKNPLELFFAGREVHEHPMFSFVFGDPK